MVIIIIINNIYYSFGSSTLRSLVPVQFLYIGHLIRLLSISHLLISLSKISLLSILVPSFKI